MPDFDFATVEKATGFLEVSPRTVLYLIERGDLPNARKADPSKATSAWLIPWDDLKAYKKSKEAPVKPPVAKKKRAQTAEA